jgi:two-component system sensor histidine kinase KdpD
MQHFRQGNLTALRACLRRVAAERVDAEMVSYMRAHAMPDLADPGPVCINECRSQSSYARRSVWQTRPYA